jgi:hypothetical protein
MRADVAVFDVPAVQVQKSNPDEVTAHALLLGEIKRDGKSAKSALKHQVSPLLKFAEKAECLALSWDGVDDRYFWKDPDDPTQEKNAGVASVPRWGEGTKAKPVTFSDLQPSESLVTLFEAIENTLHASFSTNPEERYHLIFKLLLTKLYDEGRHGARTTAALDIQDYAALGTEPTEARAKFAAIVDQAIGHYEYHLPVRRHPGSTAVFGRGESCDAPVRGGMKCREYRALQRVETTAGPRWYCWRHR